MKFQNHRKWLLFLFVTLLSLWFSGYVQRELNSFRTVVPDDLYDFHVYYIAGQVAHSETDRRLYSYKEIQNPNDSSQNIVVNPQLQPYDPDSTYGYFAKQTSADIGQYLYPPFFAAAMIPLTNLPYEKAKIVWHVLLFLLAAASVVITVKLLYEDYLTIALISGVGIMIAEFVHPMRDLLTVCNVGALILFLTVTGLWLHKKYPQLGALFFALAVFIKLTPIIVVPLMIIKGQWKWLIAFCGWSVLLLGISVWQLGWQNHREFLTRVIPSMSVGVPISENRSLSTAFYALSAGKFLKLEEVIAGEYVSPPKIPTILFKITAVVSLCALLLFFWSNSKPDSPLYIEIFILTLWSIIFAPVSFRHYYTLALAPFIFVWLHPLTKTASSLRLIILSAATFMVFSVLPNYVIFVTELFPFQLALFLVMPSGIVLCIWYLMKLLKSQKELLPENR
ncbi:MAG: DUF2029 domain-containing protein [Pyrinomonadaceae bacterium]|nr:DUF2029 domain-containing protein [Pyrinomonadaceae bacterium]